MPETSNDAQTHKLVDICSELFLLIAYLRQSKAFDAPDVLYERISALFNAMDRRAREAGIIEPDIRDAKYAIAALIDEIIGWESRMELDLFGGNVAGEEFFNKFEREKKGETPRRDVLDIYYLCLMFGFEGKYVRTPERLQAMIKEYRQKQSAETPELLSPHGQRPQENIKRRTGVPLWAPLVFAGVCIGAIVLTYVLLDNNITNLAGTVVRQLQNYSL
jgi:type VI secretion system protein ImpK